MNNQQKIQKLKALDNFVEKSDAAFLEHMKIHDRDPIYEALYYQLKTLNSQLFVLVSDKIQ